MNWSKLAMRALSEILAAMTSDGLERQSRGVVILNVCRL